MPVYARSTLFAEGAAQTSFIAEAVKGISAAGCAGVNLDWEPYAKGMTKWTPGDGAGPQPNCCTTSGPSAAAVAHADASASLPLLLPPTRRLNQFCSHAHCSTPAARAAGDGVLNEDGLLYARFLSKFSDALHGAGIELSLDFFSNLAIWNLPAMNASAVDTCAFATQLQHQS